jgi:hypothetical protein
MSQVDIRTAIDEFLDFLEHSQRDEEVNINALEVVLDQLALARHFVGDIVFEDDYPDPPVQDYDRLRVLATERFPSFGYYSVPDDITKQSNETELLVGDALDDIVDIVRDLQAVKWRWEHTNEQDALWHFDFGYKTHWGKHLRCLQLYLHLVRNKQ